MVKHKVGMDLELLENAKTYRAIKSRLHAMIGSKWPAGTRLPPIKKLATQIGAGQSNTHRAIKELAAEGLLASRAGRGTIVLDAHASIEHAPASMSPDTPISTRAIAGATVEILAHSNIQNTYLSTMIAAAQDVFIAAGCRISQHFFDLAQASDVVLDDKSADCHMIFNSGENHRVHTNTSKPFVCLSSTARISVVGSDGYDVVMADSEQGGFLLGQHLREIGCKTVCYIGVGASSSGYAGPAGRRYDYTSGLRLLGFEAGFGAKVAQPMQLYAGSYATTAGAKMVQKYLDLKPRPKAVFCATDDIAIGFVHGALAHGIEAGKDYYIVGFDGQERSRHLPLGVLTTAAIPTALMGRTAANFLITRLSCPDTAVRRLQLGCSLLVGDTTRSAST